MDDGSLSSLTILVMLMVAEAMLVLVYAAVTGTRSAIMSDMADDGHQGAQRVIRLTETPAQLSATYQFTLLLLHLLIAVTALNLSAGLAVSAPEANMLIIVAAVLGLTAVVSFIFGQVIPAALGNAYADRLAPPLSSVMRVLVLVLSPLTLVMQRLTQLLVGSHATSTVTNEEIMTLVDVGQKEGLIESEEKEMIFSVLQFDEILAHEVMVPRMDIVAVDVDTPVDEALAKFIETGHSRIPVYQDNIDNVEGLLYAKDLLMLWHTGDPKPRSIRELMRPAYFVPENKRADILLKELQHSKIHLAVVVDEYGGTAGVITIEDLVEEIVGDIQDEYDLEEEAEFIQKNESEYVIDASMSLNDLNELLDTDLPTEENNTLGGYIYSQLGRVPRVGETLTDDDHNMVMRIDSVEGRRIRKVHVTIVDETAEADTSASNGVRRTESSLLNDLSQSEQLDKAG